MTGTRWHRVAHVNILRELRRSIGLKQEQFALLLQVPLETLRTWDSGRRPVPLQIVVKGLADLNPRDVDYGG